MILCKVTRRNKYYYYYYYYYYLIIIITLIHRIPVTTSSVTTRTFSQRVDYSLVCHPAITNHVRSTRKFNVFTRVCDSVYRREGSWATWLAPSHGPWTTSWTMSHMTCPHSPGPWATWLVLPLWKPWTSWPAPLPDLGPPYPLHSPAVAGLEWSASLERSVRTKTMVGMPSKVNARSFLLISKFK